MIHTITGEGNKFVERIAFGDTVKDIKKALKSAKINKKDIVGIFKVKEVKGKNELSKKKLYGMISTKI